MCVQRRCVHILHILSVPTCHYIQMFIHLKVGFQTPEAMVVVWRDFCRRRSDSRKKPTLNPPRTTTPEIRALVAGFIGLECSPDAAGLRGEEKQKLETDMLFDKGLTWPEFVSSFCLLIVALNNQFPWVLAVFTAITALSHVLNVFLLTCLPSLELLTGISSEKKEFQSVY